MQRLIQKAWTHDFMVGAVETEVEERDELCLGAVQPADVVRCVGQLDVVSAGCSVRT
jgi:hypothetical protein